MTFVIFAMFLDEHFTVRLVGGYISSEGIVEINVAGVWGTICDDKWDSRDAAVVCRELGYIDSEVIPEQQAIYYFPYVTVKPILLGDVSCAGTESNLWMCRKPAIGQHNCISERNPAAVRCYSNYNFKNNYKHTLQNNSYLDNEHFVLNR